MKSLRVKKSNRLISTARDINTLSIMDWVTCKDVKFPSIAQPEDLNSGTRQAIYEEK